MAFVHRYARGGVAAFPFTIGTYPEMSLEEAHEIHAANRRLLARGIDPKDERERLCHGQESRGAELVLRNASGRIDGVRYDERCQQNSGGLRARRRKAPLDFAKHGVVEPTGHHLRGDGTSTFDLPDLTAAAPNNTIYLICVHGDFP
jgi:hypothetical protein